MRGALYSTCNRPNHNFKVELKLAYLHSCKRSWDQVTKISSMCKLPSTCCLNCPASVCGPLALLLGPMHKGGDMLSAISSVITLGLFSLQDVPGLFILAWISM